MIEQVSSLDNDEILELHEVCSQLMSYQIGNVGMNWLLILDRDIGMEKIYRWAGFITYLINEDFRDRVFKDKAQQLSVLLQNRFASIGLDIALWSPIFFYLGMIATMADLIGFIKITHQNTQSKLDAIGRLDYRFAKYLLRDDDNSTIFITSEVRDPMNILDQIYHTGVLDIVRIDLFKSKILQNNLSKIETYSCPVYIYQYENSVTECKQNAKNVFYYYY